MEIKEYQEIRIAGKDIASKIFELNNREELITGGKYFGFWNGNTMVMESDFDFDVLTDFLIYEKYKRTIRLFEKYFESNPELPDLEKEFLDGMFNCYASLFEIDKINRNNNTLILKDLLNFENQVVILMDIGLSLTAIPGTVFYSRLLPIRDIHITSGVSFGFDNSYKNKVLKELSFVRFKQRGKMSSADLFLFFYKKSKSYGLKIIQ